MKPEELLIIEVNMMIPRLDMERLKETIKAEMESGLVVLPNYCKASVVPKDIEVRILPKPKQQ